MRVRDDAEVNVARAGKPPIPADMARPTCEPATPGKPMLGGEAVPIWVSSFAVPSGEGVTLRIELAGPSPKDDDIPVSFYVVGDASESPGSYIEDSDKKMVKISKDRSWTELTLQTKKFQGGSKGAIRTIHVVVPNKMYSSYAVGTLVLTSDDVPKQ